MEKIQKQRTIDYIPAYKELNEGIKERKKRTLNS